jgi:ABC-type multidrug transport system fused ATPase/permease subunit
VDDLRAKLDLAGIDVLPEAVIIAGKTIAILLGTCIAVFSGAVLLTGAYSYFVMSVFLGAIVPPLSMEVILSYPGSAANKRAAEVLKGSPEAANLMIMSLRHEPSLSKAIRFASKRSNAFSQELGNCIWFVVMGKHASFEESLQQLGSKWARYGNELKASLNAMVTASCEATEDGKRRALDRANQSMISGARRRIEEYALSLSAPSMLMFGLGILLPLMVGSFLPMLSWNLWSPETAGEGSLMQDQSQATLETIVLMNVMFPAIAALVATSAASRHPIEVRRKRIREEKRFKSTMALSTLAVSGVACILSVILLEGVQMSLALLLGSIVPLSALMMIIGREGTQSGTKLAEEDMEDALFKTGARMLEGENFEAALSKAGQEMRGPAGDGVRRLSFGSIVSGKDIAEMDVENDAEGQGENALDGIKVVKEAASKDELAAGVLAMDLAAYLKDLHDLESTLKNRLKPTISMMRLTAYALGPIVLGVTFAIYLSLAGMMGPGSAGIPAEVFFLVLGAFLAESNAVVSYFVWGIEGRRDIRDLFRSLGACILVSGLIYSATAMIVA